MDYYLKTPTDDLWLFETEVPYFTYNLILKPIQVRNIAKACRIVDRKGHLHLLLLNQSKQAFHVIWDNYAWKKEPLPFVEWNEILTFIDSADILYILIKNSSGFHISTSPAVTGFPEIKFSMDSSNLHPLFFTVDNSKLYFYLLNDARNMLRVTTICRETGKLLLNHILKKSDAFSILKHWVIEDSIILILGKKTSSQADLYLMKISLRTKKHWEEQFSLSNLNKDTSYHLLTDQSNLLLLISTPSDFYYTYSFDAGQRWTYPQQSTLFSPIAFRDIYTVNDFPTSSICVKELKGCTLQHPLIINYTEFSAMIQSNKEKLKNTRIISPKIQKR